jgi:hypothetical protein
MEGRSWSAITAEERGNRVGPAQPPPGSYAGQQNHKVRRPDVLGKGKAGGPARERARPFSHRRAMSIDIGEKMSECISIPYAKSYTANLMGATLKLVRSEK